MLFLARFAGDQRPILVGGVDADDALEQLAQEIDGVPMQLHPVPEGLICLEVCFADPEAEGDPNEHNDNPGNGSEAGVALDPMGPFAEWLHETDDLPLVELATAPTEPAPDAAGQ